MLPTTETARMSCGLLLLAADITAAALPLAGAGSACFLFSCLHIMIRAPYIYLYVNSVLIQSSTIYASKTKRLVSEGIKRVIFLNYWLISINMPDLINGGDTVIVFN
jgi:hypothetical protein